MKTTVKTIVIEATPCPRCGNPMPTGALAGLCPACLLAQGLATEEGGPPKGRHFEPPPLDEVAKLFPQLEIQSLLGAGGMGAVYKARQPALDRIVALKVLPATNTGGVNFEERFNREARALARLNHPNIVTVHEFGQAGGLHFFIMEFVDGANLRQLEQAGRLAPREALQIIPQICDALQYAHDEGIVHRDIKPENVLVDRKGRVKIADFGLAKILGAESGTSRLTLEGQVMGTPHYMAPEQIEKPLSVDHRADIYSLGVVLYEMLTGDLPLGKFAPPSRKYQLDVRLDDVVLRALENDPARRYQHASEVKSQVENIAGTPAPAAPTPPKPEPNFIRWAGFPVVTEREGMRKVNRKEAFKMFGVFFGVLTIAFGIVSLITGRSLFGWIGIAGSLSLQMRLLIAALVSLFGVWCALRSKPGASAQPQTPQGTVILPPEKFSRKALIGACWIPFTLFAFLGLYVVNSDEPVANYHGPYWWQVLLAVVTLPLGFTAPFGTTILGWLAVADIRRAQGRISGLPLAVFGGLFFPLLALDGLLVWGWSATVQILQKHAVFEPFHAGEVSVLTKLCAAVICMLVDLLIIRRVWRAVSLNDGVNKEPWWSSTRGAMIVGLACVLIIFAVALRRETPPPVSLGIFKNAPQQVAAPGGHYEGGWWAPLPNGGTMELIALSDAGAAPADWWHPDGKSVTPWTFEVKGPRDVSNPGKAAKDLIFRFDNLPEQNVWPIIECDPRTDSSSGGTVLLNNEPLPDARPIRMAWPESAHHVTIRLGVSLVPWRTVTTTDQINHSTAHTRRAGDPERPFEFLQAVERDGQTQLTFIRGRDDGKWQTGVVAVDTKGVEHGYTSAIPMPSASNEAWTYTCTFPVPLAQVKEFRAQIRPLYWVEFRDVVVQPRDRPAGQPATTTAPEVAAELWAPTVATGEKPNLDKIWTEAGEMIKRGDYEAALQRHIWLHNHALEVNDGMTGVRLSFYLSEWVDLGRRYPKAKQALIEMRDLKSREFDEGRGYSKLFQDVQSINYYLNADDATAALFKRIHQRDPKLAAQCVHYARVALVKSHEYELCLSYIPDVQADFESHKTNRDRDLASAMRNPSMNNAQFRKSADVRFVTEVSQLIEMLTGVGRVAEAESIRAQAKAIVEDPNLWATESEPKRREADGLVLKTEPLPAPKLTGASLETWTPTVNPGESLDLSKLLEVARAMFAARDYESALQRFIWIHNHARKNGGDPLGGISDWIELGRRFPKARQALIELRDLKAYEFEKGRGYNELFQEIWIMNRSLGAEDMTTRLFIRLREVDPALARQCIWYARDALVKSKEYELCLSYFPDAQADFMRCVEARDMDKQMTIKMPSMNTPFYHKSIDARFIGGVSQLMEMLNGVGRVNEAENIRTQAVAIVDAPEFRKPAK